MFNNILVIGNGFDIAHGLPTKYSHFLLFSKLINDCYKYRDSSCEIKERLRLFEIDNKDMVGKIYIPVERLLKDKIDIVEYFNNLLYDKGGNLWLDYFMYYMKRQKEIYNTDYFWVDIEEAISQVIYKLTNMSSKEWFDFFNSKNKLAIISIILNFNRKYDTNVNNADEEVYNYRIEGSKINYYNRLYTDFNNFIEAFEIYLSEFIVWENIKPIDNLFNNLRFGNIVNFNYTDTYSKLYGTVNNIDFIHGACRSYAELNNRSSNIVLGIDEFLPSERRNRELDLIDYRKYYQRIIKHTDNIYISTVLNKTDFIEVYFYGHSMSVTDIEILINLLPHAKNKYSGEDFRSENAVRKATIFYYNASALKSIVLNLVKILGQNSLIELTSGPGARIVFKQCDEAVNYTEF